MDATGKGIPKKLKLDRKRGMQAFLGRCTYTECSAQSGEREALWLGP